MTSHDLAPYPAQLARLLQRDPSQQSGAHVDAYLKRHSTYRNVGEWLDAPGNVEERRRLGLRICEILADRSSSLLEE